MLNLAVLLEDSARETRATPPSSSTSSSSYAAVNAAANRVAGGLATSASTRRQGSLSCPNLPFFPSSTTAS